MIRTPLKTSARRKSRWTTVICSLLILVAISAVAYEPITHSAISRRALLRDDCILSSTNSHPFLQENVLPDGFFDPNALGATPLSLSTQATADGQTMSLGNWIAYGSEHEDDADFSLFGVYRPLRHFYNPITKQGLSDTALFHIRTGTVFADSMSWAWNGAILTGEDNLWDWQHAREYEYHWLTDADEASRNTASAHSFRALGQVMHLLEDTAQPQHTRNDAHTLPALGGTDAPYEHYCGAHYGNLAQVSLLAEEDLPIFDTINPSVFDNRGIPQQFRALWDTEQYHGIYPFGGLNTLGLAEYSNLNFVTNHTMFTGQTAYVARKPSGDLIHITLVDVGSDDVNADLHHFPYPRIANTSLINLDPLPGNRPYILNRVGQRIKGTPLQIWNGGVSDLYGDAFTTYIDPTLRGIGKVGQIGLTDTNYEVYAQKLIPKAVSYSTKLLNYFFRGTLDVKITWGGSQQNILTITNTSTDEMKEGTWELYLDTADKVRRKISEFNASLYTGLKPNASFSAFFPEQMQDGRSTLCDGGNTYTLVFKGTIGDEKNIAIAVKRFNGIPEVWQGPYTVPSVDMDGVRCVGEVGTLTLTFKCPSQSLQCTGLWVSAIRNETIEDIPGSCDGSQITIGGPGTNLYGINANLSTDASGNPRLTGTEIWGCPAGNPIVFVLGTVALSRVQ